METNTTYMLKNLKAQTTSILIIEWSSVRTEQSEAYTWLVPAIIKSGSGELEKAGYKSWNSRCLS